MLRGLIVHCVEIKLEIPSQLRDQADKFHRRSTIPPSDAFHTETENFKKAFHKETRNSKKAFHTKTENLEKNFHTETEDVKKAFHTETKNFKKLFTSF